MIDLFGFPEAQLADVQVYGPTGSWVGWVKPRGRSFLGITCIGGGAGGGGGRGRHSVPTSTGSGGGGGGSSGITRIIYPLAFIPASLLILVGAAGAGGAGGAAGVPDGSNGDAGGLSYVSMYPDVAANNLFAVSGAAASQGGDAGHVASVGGAGGQSTIATVAGCPFSCWGKTQFIAGVVGTNGGNPSGGNGVAKNIVTGCMILGGTGGGGADPNGNPDGAGGVYNALANTIFGAVPGGTAGTAGPGSPGFRFGKYPMVYGGTGGGATSTGAVGGAGGYGIMPGSGGGGGGAATATGGVGGRGGDGGPGLVIMACW